MTAPDDDLHVPSSGRCSTWAGWLVGLAALAVVASVSLHLAEERELARVVEGARPAWLLVALALQATTYVADAGVWGQVLARAGLPARLRSLVPISVGKLFLNQALPTVGIAGTVFLVQALDRRGVRREVSLAAVVVWQITYQVAYAAAVACALLVVGLRHRLTPAVVVPGAVLILYAGVTVLLLVGLAQRRLRLPARLLRRRSARALVSMVEGASRDLVTDRRLIGRALALQAAVFVLDATTLWIALLALGAPAPPTLVFASFMAASVTRTLGVVPGGLGTFEAVSVAGLHASGVPLSAALAGTLLFRGLSFWLPMLPGVIAARRATRRAAPSGPAVRAAGPRTPGAADR